MIALLEAMRPKQWVKNGFVFAVALFSGRIFEPEALIGSLGAFAVFCLAGSAVYLINDLRDVEADRLHPVKKNRPLASGRLGKGLSKIAALVLIHGAVVIALSIGEGLLWTVSIYLFLQTAYSLGAKRWAIIDVMIIATGFILRVIAGGVAIDQAFSNWILINTFLLALFLGFGKRRHELATLEGDAGGHRVSLKDYSLPFLDQMISVTASATAVVYMIYTASDEIMARFNHHPVNMSLTIPFVLFGLFRYFYIVHQRAGGGSPTQELLGDGPLLAAVALYVLTVLGLYYLHPAFHL